MKVRIRLLIPLILVSLLITGCGNTMENTDVDEVETTQSDKDTTLYDVDNNVTDDTSQTDESTSETVENGNDSDNNHSDSDGEDFSSDSQVQNEQETNDNHVDVDLEIAPQIQQTIVDSDIWNVEISNYSKKFSADDGTMILNYESQDLVITNSNNAQAAENVTAYLAEQASNDGETYDDVTKQAKDYYALDKGSETFGGYYYSLTYNATDTNGFLSIVKHSRSYFGGVHDSFYETAFVFDSNGERIYIDDLFTDPEKGREEVISYVKGLIDDMDQSVLYEKEMYIDFIPDLFSDEYESWYLSDEGIEIICNAYTIAPYAAGSFYFTVPYEAIDGWSDIVPWMN